MDRRFVLVKSRKFGLFDRDGRLDRKEFAAVCRSLFRNDRGKIYSLEPKQMEEVFDMFDRNKVKTIYNS